MKAEQIQSLQQSLNESRQDQSAKTREIEILQQNQTATARQNEELQRSLNNKETELQRSTERIDVLHSDLQSQQREAQSLSQGTVLLVPTLVVVEPVHVF